METGQFSPYDKQAYGVQQAPVPWWLTWPVMLPLLVVMPPLGIFLVWKRDQLHKKPALSTGKGWRGAGWFMIIVGILNIFAIVTEGAKASTDDIAPAVIICFGSGMGFLSIAAMKKKKAHIYHRYISIIEKRETSSMDAIAASTHVPYEVVRKDLQTLIHKGFLSGIRINDAQRKIIYSQDGAAAYDIRNSGPHMPQTSEMAVVVCNGCGANNKIAKGAVGECEFCGSPISAH